VGSESGRRALVLLTFLLLHAVLALPQPARSAAAAAADEAGSETDEAEEADEAEEEVEEEEELRERLTEREDKRRPLEPWSVQVGGRPLTVGGEYEIELGYVRRRLIGDFEQPDRLLLEQGLDLEAFYTFGPPLSLFAQIHVAMEEDLLSDTFEEVSDAYVEREEMWLYSENVAGSHFNVSVGRLDFEDERRWWWDTDLDALRVEYERETFDVALAVAYELAPARSDQDFIDPESDDVLRVIGEAGWEWYPNQAFEFFLLHQDDHSPHEQVGEVVSFEREDDSDARLTWLGARAIGIVDLGSPGLLGYWLDTAVVRGDERFAEFEDLTRSSVVVEEVGRRDVRGWAVDAGLTWILPVAYEPRLFAGYAIGSGDPNPDTGTDRSFRQTGVEENEAGFGGFERFPNYGVLLDPELSNLGVVTAGVGVSLFRSSSLDLVYHAYRLVEPSTSLTDARLEAELDGRDRDLGHEVDLVLALEEWERLEFTFAVSAFRAGRAFGPDRGTWSFGAFGAMRIAF
jgi:hypothetical protein